MLRSETTAIPRYLFEICTLFFESNPLSPLMTNSSCKIRVFFTRKLNWNMNYLNMKNCKFFDIDTTRLTNLLLHEPDEVVHVPRPAAPASAANWPPAASRTRAIERGNVKAKMGRKSAVGFAISPCSELNDNNYQHQKWWSTSACSLILLQAQRPSSTTNIRNPSEHDPFGKKRAISSEIPSITVFRRRISASSWPATWEAASLAIWPADRSFERWNIDYQQVHWR